MYYLSITRSDRTLLLNSCDIALPPKMTRETDQGRGVRIFIDSASDLVAAREIVNGNDRIVSELARLKPTHTDGDSSLPSFSIIIPCKPGSQPLSGVRALSSLDYSPGKVELIIVKGTHPSVQRNIAAALSEADLLAFIDDDCEPDPHWLTNSATYFQDPDVTIVGGPNLTPASDPPMARRIGLACSSFWGTASMRTRYRVTGAKDDASEANLVLSNLICRRSVFENGIGFSSRLFPNEENHFMNQIREQGQKMVYSPDVKVFHPRKRSLKSFFLQFMGYGIGRGNQSRMDPKSLKVLHLLPSAFVAGLVMLPLTIALGVSPLWIFLAASLFLYLATTLLASSRIAIREREPSLLIHLPAIFTLLHLAYGIGLIMGLLRPFRNKAATLDPSSVCTEAISISVR